MKRFTLVQDLDMDVAAHWKLFLDEGFDRELYLEGLGFHGYELLESRSNEAEEIRRIRVVPKLEVPAAVRKALGSKFAYTEDGRFDKKTQTWRASMTPSMFADRMTCVTDVRCAEAGPGKLRRTIDGTLEAKVFGIGGLLEGALEKSVRSGWEQNARYMAARARR